MSCQTNFKIDEKVLKSAVRCEEDCACTKNDWESCGKISESDSGMILLIEEAENEDKMHACKYHLPFGGEHYCICPARLYIYKNFGV